LALRRKGRRYSREHFFGSGKAFPFQGKEGKVALVDWEKGEENGTASRRIIRLWGLL